MSVTLLQILAAARARRASVAAEVAGYLVFAAADQVAGAPRCAEPVGVELGEDGSVRVSQGVACSAADAALAMRSLLSQLLEVASSATPSLLRVARSAASSDADALVLELETALIPVNYAASRRALARLHRETARALAAGGLEIEDAAVESALPGLAELELALSAPANAAVSRAAPLAETALPKSEIAEAEPAAAGAYGLELAELVQLPEVVAEPETRPEPVMLRVAARCFAAELGARTPALGTLAPEAPVSDETPSPTVPMVFAITDPTFERDSLSDRDPAECEAEPVPAPCTGLDAEEDWVEADDFDGDDEALGAFDSELDPAPHCGASNDEYVERGASVEIRDVEPVASPEAEAVQAPPRFRSSRSDVSELLAGFGAPPARSEQDLRRDLKQIAELGPTLSDIPPPVATDRRRGR